MTRNSFAPVHYFKRSLLVLLLIVALSGCGGSNGGDNTVTVPLSGTVTQGQVQNLGQGNFGSGNPAVGVTVSVTDIQKTGTTNADGAYSIEGVPVGGGYTITAVVTIDEVGNNEPNPDPVSCAINIADSTTMTITNDGNGACSSSGTLVLNIVLP